MLSIGKSIKRADGWDKVRGKAKYTADINYPGMLYSKIKLSSEPHAEIISITVAEAMKVQGVISVVIGEDCQVLTGVTLKDRPPLAFGRVRYYGEPVAIVIANDERAAEEAVEKIIVEYKPLPIINTPSEALDDSAFLIHDPIEYEKAQEDIYPIAGKNIAHKVSIRKGDVENAFKQCEYIVEAKFFVPQCDHIAMETRTAIAEIMSDGSVNIITSSQCPYIIKQQIADCFKIDEVKVNVTVPLVGGAFGGKSSVNLELLAYIASKAVGGRPVKLVNKREHDIISSPCKEGLEAYVKLGADKDGKFLAADIKHLIDNGAYSDLGPKIAQAMAVDCTGPYLINNVFCDSLSVYTNHPYITAFRGFGHSSATFCIERAIDKLSKMSGINAFDLRYRNLIGYEDETPNKVKLNVNNFSDIKACYDRMKSLLSNDIANSDNSKIRSIGFSSFWKTSNTPTDAVSGAVVTFNEDGSANLSCGAVEFGQASKTHLAAILSEVLRLDISKIYVKYQVDTGVDPRHWKTVASITTFLAGKAVIKAAEDVVKQLKELASIALRCPVEDLDYGYEKVFIKHNPDYSICYRDLVHGLKYDDGNTIGGQIIGRGGYGVSNLVALSTDEGKGKTGPEWTAGVQAAEVEYDNNNDSYTINRVITVIDVGKVMNPDIDTGIIKGGMSMGIGLVTDECLYYDSGRVTNTSLRTYSVRHKQDKDPEFIVEFIETPNIEAPFGTRAFSEHGIIGIPAAIANALSNASGVELDTLPIYPEIINIVRGANNDTI